MNPNVQTPLQSSPTSSPKDVARARLDRLEGFLRADPNNASLLADAFQTALQSAEWERAQFHVSHGKALHPEDLQWPLREGDLLLAQQRFGEAKDLLEPLLQTPNAAPAFLDAVLHNMAYADFQQGDFVVCVQRLAERLDVARLAAEDGQQQPAPALAAMQILWLRALHRTGEIDRAVAWTKAAATVVTPAAAGVASLAALDAGDVAAAGQWSALALQHAGAQDRPMEALVTQASLALAARNATGARALAGQALQLNDKDGRAWSALAFADLLAAQPKPARDHFALALTYMPGHIGTWHGQGWTDLLLRDLDAALISFQTALELDRNFAESHGGLAVVLALKGMRAEAEEHIERAARLDRANLSGRYAQAILSGEVSDMQALQRLAKRLLGDRAAPLGGAMYDSLSHLWVQAEGDAGADAVRGDTQQDQHES
jgi:tetratricopeptide (TPR) repeat protein